MQRDLADRATAGDHAAFAELASDAIGRLYRVAYLILRDTDAANDAVQNALIAAWRGVRGLRDPDRFDAWLHRLTVRECYRLARAQRRRSAQEVEFTELHELASVDEDHRLMAVRDQLDRDSYAYPLRSAPCWYSITTWTCHKLKQPRCWGCPSGR